MMTLDLCTEWKRTDQFCNHRRRFILAEESSFFEAKFRSPEFARADGSIELRDIDGATLLAVIGSLFTAELPVSNDTVRDVLFCADMLHVR
jgi:hypothetical protein